MSIKELTEFCSDLKRPFGTVDFGNQLKLLAEDDTTAANLFIICLIYYYYCFLCDFNYVIWNES